MSGGGGGPSKAQANAVAQASQYSAEATKYASDMASSTADKQMAMQQQFYDTQRADTATQRQLGQQSVGTLITDMAPGGSLQRQFTTADMMSDPGYRLRVQQGLQSTMGYALQGSGLDTSMGNLTSAMDKYNQGFASNEFQNSYNRFTTDQNNMFGKLMGTAQLGQKAVGVGAGNIDSMGRITGQLGNTLGSLATANGANQANLQMQLGNMQGGPSKGQAAMGGAMSGAMMGATIGSVIPGLGTVIGGVIGGVVGGLASLF